MTNQNTNTAMEVRPKRASEIMAGRLSVDPGKLMQTLKSTVFKGATDDELLALIVVANQYQLDPFVKQIYAFPAKGGGIVPVVSIDGWISIINRQEGFDGVQFKMEDDANGAPFSCTAIMSVKGRSKPVEITEYFAECFRSTEPWKTMPRRMLRHKTLIQCGRVAFGISGIFDKEEAEMIAAEVTKVETVKPGQHKITVLAQSEPEPAAAPESTPEPSEQSAAVEPSQNPSKGAGEVMDWCGEAGIKLDQLKKWATEKAKIDIGQAQWRGWESLSDIAVATLQANNCAALSAALKWANGGAK